MSLDERLSTSGTAHNLSEAGEVSRSHAVHAISSGARGITLSRAHHAGIGGTVAIVLLLMCQEFDPRGAFFAEKKSLTVP
jgi:hypothetical protein